MFFGKKTQAEFASSTLIFRSATQGFEQTMQMGMEPTQPAALLSGYDNHKQTPFMEEQHQKEGKRKLAQSASEDKSAMIIVGVLVALVAICMIGSMPIVKALFGVTDWFEFFKNFANFR